MVMSTQVGVVGTLGDFYLGGGQSIGSKVSLVNIEKRAKLEMLEIG